MRRLSLVLFVLALCAGVFAYAVEVNIGYPVLRFPHDDVDGSIQVGSSAVISGLPTSYTVYAKAQDDDFYLKRFFAGVKETDWIYVPAGKSLLVPAATPVYAGGVWRASFSFTGVAAGDTIFILPWGK